MFFKFLWLQFAEFKIYTNQSRERLSYSKSMENLSCFILFVHSKMFSPRLIFTYMNVQTQSRLCAIRSDMKRYLNDFTHSFSRMSICM